MFVMRRYSPLGYTRQAKLSSVCKTDEDPADNY